MIRRSLVCALVVACFCTQSHAELFHYSAFLDGPSESPPVPSPGTGFATAVYDDAAHTLTLHVEFEGLVGTTTVSHIHGPTALPFAGTASVATTTPTFAGFPAGVTAGTYDVVLDLTQASSYNPSFVTANGGSLAASEIALTDAIADGKAYLNIHSTFSTSGEIRGFFIPEPASLSLLALGAMFIRRRR